MSNEKVHSKELKFLPPDVTEQCTVFGRRDFQTVGSERVTKAASVMFGLALLSATVSTVELVTLKFRANNTHPSPLRHTQ